MYCTHVHLCMCMFVCVCACMCVCMCACHVFHVPCTTQLQLIVRTGSVDVTVSNLLDGTVPYRPSSNTGTPAPNSSVERRPTNSGSSAAARTPPDSASAAARPSPGAAPAAKGMTPKRSWSSMQRHLVLEERKAALIEEARRLVCVCVYTTHLSACHKQVALGYFTLEI